MGYKSVRYQSSKIFPDIEGSQNCSPFELEGCIVSLWKAMFNHYLVVVSQEHGSTIKAFFQSQSTYPYFDSYKGSY